MRLRTLNATCHGVAPRLRRRRGLSAFTLILSISLIFALIALAVDVGLLVQRHQQLKTAGEAAALAAALQLFDAPAHLHTPGRELTARNAAVAFAAENSFSVPPLQLSANVANQPDGDIVLGTVDPLELGSPFLPDRGNTDQTQPVSFERMPFDGPPGLDVAPPFNQDSRVNAVLVRTRHSQAGGVGPLLFFGQMVGVPSHDIYTESIAAVERRVCGFRPVGCTPIPLLPILCRTKRWLPSDWPGNSGEQYDDGQFLPDQASDQAEEATSRLGQVEFKILLKSNSSEGQSENDDDGADENDDEAPPFKRGKTIPARLLSLIAEDSEALLDQIVYGLSSSDLTECGGEVCVGDQVPCHGNAGNPGGSQPQIDRDQLHQVLQSIVGQPRLLPLGCAIPHNHGQYAGRIEDFVACVIVHSQLHDDAITILVQPIALNSCTAIVDTHANPNPWVGKVLLVK